MLMCSPPQGFSGFHLVVLGEPIFNHTVFTSSFRKYAMFMEQASHTLSHVTFLNDSVESQNYSHRQCPTGPL